MDFILVILPSFLLDGNTKKKKEHEISIKLLLLSPSAVDGE
jgi:hypothetical protein